MTLTLRQISFFVALTLASLTAGCARQSLESRAAGEVFDPHEGVNRSIHSFNLGVDRALFRPASNGYVAVVPPEIVTSFGLFSENLSMPGQAVNGLLQGDLPKTGLAISRLLINTVLGLGGLFDPASDFNIPRVDTDFGETLHVWGFGEGAYVELPFYGPSTTRDAVGVVADFFTNPITFARQNPADNIGVYAEIVRRMGDRGNYSATIDSILYESADSYAQARLIYLQNRRFELGGDQDSFEGVFGDPYSDPYEDIYAE
ncbi:VacJ lipoprotein [Sedimentitalea sp. CY04]|uniref:VacJ lipoprotein n=1 Tax=Parasedimentitalea denitrificans TaxID=2211118 RepID=A0ABX0W5X7_9RHOB|nr:VacJ family lipoprotein [Sedimentitalea sp. CY04]NIZ61061.1 VacJ lipoprotein [Sedimentitalea sp. CY04]